ncbi:N,N-dimethylformamidase beta subunit family domain-containing protein [Catellatospora sichuanensis]|uniref:N,N-dimethylformamidase beta subunit family domain-containing protein n=1 Tax=Catellatospora sichuanensis TaxID=1969805 RepID=UPI001C9225CA|nr:N,N-dimethylformamidase beta subunit family domain-containing protein [Catellatospora sichuanensis]
MAKFTRRAAARVFAIGATGALTGAALTQAVSAATAQDPSSKELHPTARENMNRGSSGWRLGKAGRDADPKLLQVSGYASATSVNLGESITFHVSVSAEETHVVEIYRLGWYGGEGARKVAESSPIPHLKQPDLKQDPGSGMITCDWSPTWALKIQDSWASGAYLAVFTTASGYRNFTPFVVRDDARRAPFCVVMPFTTYQAYNMWPRDGVRGKDLYNGYLPDGDVTYSNRATSVSFDRPYPYHGGLPSRFEYDHWFINWAEAEGHDLVYATSIDLHAGRIDPTRYAGLLFPGHDEYWSQEMIDVATKAIAAGTSLAFMEANNVYWNIRLSPSADGRPDRVMTCYKLDKDPAPDASGPTTQWRLVDRAGTKAEQRLLGVQFNGQPAEAAPLVVRAADHWFWAGTGVKDGDQIADVVGGETDGVQDKFPLPEGEGLTRTILAESPFKAQNGTTIVQNSSVYETESGAIVFACGSNDWPAALSAPGGRDPRIQRATANVLNRILSRWSA